MTSMLCLETIRVRVGLKKDEDGRRGGVLDGGRLHDKEAGSDGSALYKEI